MMMKQNATNKVEKRLAHFDMDANFGPKQGMKRSERWERAYKLGKNPPSEVLQLLKEFPHLDKRFP